jgi:hypothetical protein
MSPVTCHLSPVPRTSLLLTVPRLVLHSFSEGGCLLSPVSCLPSPPDLGLRTSDLAASALPRPPLRRPEKPPHPRPLPFLSAPLLKIRLGRRQRCPLAPRLQIPQVFPDRPPILPPLPLIQLPILRQYTLPLRKRYRPLQVHSPPPFQLMFSSCAYCPLSAQIQIDPLPPLHYHLHNQFGLCPPT